MHVVDTNVLLYAANRSAPEHTACLRVLEALRATPRAWYLTWGICFEFLRVVTHPRVFEFPWTATEAWQFLEALFAAPGCRVLASTETHVDTVRALLATSPDLRGNIFHHAETVALMQANGVSRIITRDTDFHRFRDIEVVDPLTFEAR